jgi:hypothetical protein
LHKGITSRYRLDCERGGNATQRVSSIKDLIGRHGLDLALLAFAFTVYVALAATLAKGYFVWDDTDFRYAATHLWPKSLISAAPWAGIRYRPSVLLFFKGLSAFALNVPAVWYLFNPTVHILNGILFIRLFELSKGWPRALVCFLLLPALWGTLLFISDVGDVMGLFFFLSTALLFVKSEKKGVAFISLITAFFAYASKETYFLLPLFLFLVLKYRERSFGKRERFFLCGHVIVLLAFLLVRALVIGDIMGGYGGVAAVPSMLAKGVVAIPLFLKGVLSFFVVRNVGVPIPGLLFLIFCLFSLPIAFGHRKKGVLAVLMFLLALVPSSFLLGEVVIDPAAPVGFCAARFLYFPLFFLVLLVSFIARKLPETLKYALLVVFIGWSAFPNYFMTSSFRDYSLQRFKGEVDHIVEVARAHQDRVAFIKPFAGDLDDMFIVYNRLLDAKLRRPSFGRWDIDHCDRVFLLDKGCREVSGPFVKHVFTLSPSDALTPDVPFNWSPPYSGILQFFYKEIPQFPIASSYAKPGGLTLGAGLYRMSPPEICWRVVDIEGKVVSQRVCIKKAHR